MRNLSVVSFLVIAFIIYNMIKCLSIVFLLDPYICHFTTGALWKKEEQEALDSPLLFWKQNEYKKNVCSCKDKN